MHLIESEGGIECFAFRTDFGKVHPPLSRGLSSDFKDLLKDSGGQSRTVRLGSNVSVTIGWPSN